jgi:hypothetical protein
MHGVFPTFIKDSTGKFGPKKRLPRQVNFTSCRRGQFPAGIWLAPISIAGETKEMVFKPG